MPRYYLHIHSDGQIIEDPEGQTYPDIATAIAEAQDAARQMLAERVRMGEEIDGQEIEIGDEAGMSVARVRFRDQLKLRTDD